MSFGNNIKKLRIENNMTQKDLADKLNLSRPTIGRYESDERFPDRDVILEIAKIFNITTDALFGLEIKNNTNKVMEPELSFNASYLENFLLKNNVDIKNLEDENFMEDLLNFGLNAALKIKLVRENN